MPIAGRDWRKGGYRSSWWINSNTCFPRLTAARTRLGSAVQTKGLGSALVSATKRLMASLQVDDGLEDAALETLACELGEEAFNGVEPGRRGRGEVEGPARVAGQPSAHLRVFVGGIVVDDGMDHFSRRNLRLDRY